MINCPDGFDARIVSFLFQPYLHGTSNEHPINLVFLINNVLFANLTMVMDSKLHWELKYLLKEADIIFKSLSIKDSLSKLESVAQILPTFKVHFVTLIKVGPYIMDRQDIIVTQQDHIMALNLLQEI